MEPSIGQRLAEARRAQGLEVLDVAHRTRIRPDLVRQLEADQLEAFPGAAYARSFQRLYARHLGVALDDDDAAGTIGAPFDSSTAHAGPHREPEAGGDPEPDAAHPLSAPGLASAASGAVLAGASRVRPAAGVLVTTIVALLVIPFAYVRFGADARDRGAHYPRPAEAAPEVSPSVAGESGAVGEGGGAEETAEVPVFQLSSIVTRPESRHPEVAALREQEIGVLIPELAVDPEPEVQPEPVVAAAPAPPRSTAARPARPTGRREAQAPPPRARPVEPPPKRGFFERLFGGRR